MSELRWEVGNGNAPIPSTIAVVTADGLRIADVHVWATMIGDDKWRNPRLIAAAPEMFAELAKWSAIDCDQYPYPPCCQADCLPCSARALHARIVQFGPHAHAGVWISKETADEISRDGH